MGSKIVGQLGHKREGGAAVERICTMTAGFAALRHDDAGPCFKCHGHLFKALHLANQGHIGSCYAGRIGPRIAKRQHDGARLVCAWMRQHPIQRAGVFVELPGDEATA